MGGIWIGVCWRSDSVWLWRCGVFMQSEALRFFSLRNYKDDARSNKHKTFKVHQFPKSGQYRYIIAKKSIMKNLLTTNVYF